jgi:hypothetical protein
VGNIDQRLSVLVSGEIFKEYENKDGLGYFPHIDKVPGSKDQGRTNPEFQRQIMLEFVD